MPSGHQTTARVVAIRNSANSIAATTIPDASRADTSNAVSKLSDCFVWIQEIATSVKLSHLAFWLMLGAQVGLGGKIMLACPTDEHGRTCISGVQNTHTVSSIYDSVWQNVCDADIEVHFTRAGQSSSGNQYVLCRGTATNGGKPCLNQCTDPSFCGKEATTLFFICPDRSSHQAGPERAAITASGTPRPAAGTAGDSTTAAPAPLKAAAAPVPTPNGDIFEVSGRLGTGVLEMRSGPGKKYPAVAALHLGDGGIRFLGGCRQPQAEPGAGRDLWCMFIWNGKTGWLPHTGLQKPEVRKQAPVKRPRSGSTPIPEFCKLAGTC